MIDLNKELSLLDVVKSSQLVSNLLSESICNATLYTLFGECSILSDTADYDFLKDENSPCYKLLNLFTNIQDENDARLETFFVFLYNYSQNTFSLENLLKYLDSTDYNTHYLLEFINTNNDLTTAELLYSYSNYLNAANIKTSKGKEINIISFKNDYFSNNKLYLEIYTDKVLTPRIDYNQPNTNSTSFRNYREAIDAYRNHIREFKQQETFANMINRAAQNISKLSMNSRYKTLAASMKKILESVIDTGPYGATPFLNLPNRQIDGYVDEYDLSKILNKYTQISNGNPADSLLNISQTDFDFELCTFLKWAVTNHVNPDFSKFEDYLIEYYKSLDISYLSISHLSFIYFMFNKIFEITDYDSEIKLYLSIVNDLRTIFTGVLIHISANDSRFTLERIK